MVRRDDWGCVRKQPLQRKSAVSAPAHTGSTLKFLSDRESLYLIKVTSGCGTLAVSGRAHPGT